MHGAVSFVLELSHLVNKTVQEHILQYFLIQILVEHISSEI